MDGKGKPVVNREVGIDKREILKDVHLGNWNSAFLFEQVSRGMNGKWQWVRSYGALCPGQRAFQGEQYVIISRSGARLFCFGK